MTGKKQLLAALLGILVLALGYAYWATPRQRHAGSSPRSRVERTPTPEERSKALRSDQRRVRLDLLERGTDAFSEPQRDIFHLRQARPPRPLVAPPPPAPVAVVPPPVAVPVAQSLPPEPLPHFTLLGYLQKEGRKTVFLAQDHDIFIVNPGQRFGAQQEYFAAELTEQQLLIRKDGLAAPIKIPLTDLSPAAIDTSFKRPLVTGRSNTFAAPVFRKPPEQAVVSDESGRSDLPPLPGAVESAEETSTKAPPPTEGSAAGGGTDEGMSSLKLRSVFQ